LRHLFRVRLVFPPQGLVSIGFPLKDYAAKHGCDSLSGCSLAVFQKPPFHCTYQLAVAAPPTDHHHSITKLELGLRRVSDCELYFLARVLRLDPVFISKTDDYKKTGSAVSK